MTFGYSEVLVNFPGFDPDGISTHTTPPLLIEHSFFAEHIAPVCLVCSDPRDGSRQWDRWSHWPQHLVALVFMPSMKILWRLRLWLYEDPRTTR